MSDFLGDYERGKLDGRYIPAELPDLPFAPSSFDIALCSHFLFFYSDSLSLAFHQQAVDELCRVAHEIRIFPLVTYNAEPSPLVTPIAEHARKAGRIVSLEKVPYEFQRGGNLMMKVLNGRSKEGIALSGNSPPWLNPLRMLAERIGSPDGESTASRTLTLQPPRR